MASKPTKLDIRAYNIGFGDCFLLTFHYGKKERRHMLVDFGTTRKPDDADKDHELQIANDIAAVADNQLDVVVATHRHKDHISGFATKKKASDADQSGDVIRACAKDAVVIMPWTEDPEAATDATHATKQAFVQQLNSMHGFAAAVVREIDHDVSEKVQADADVNDPTELAASGGPKQRMHREESDDGEGGNWFSTRTLRRRLRFIGEDAISNVSAVRNLVTMSKKSKRHYVNYGYKLDLSKVLPGVKVKFLGPPNIDQWPAAQNQKAKNKEEYWHLQAGFWQRLALNSNAAMPDADRAEPLFPNAPVCEAEVRCSHPQRCEDIPRASEWFVRRLRGIRAKQLMQLVLSMDNALNNTSVIMLIEAGGKKLLFPGDAQWENWEFALRQAPEAEKNLEELADVDVYKVGHHGSLNATPKTLWNNFKKRSDQPDAKSRMLSIISTKKGVHAHSPQTAVPRSTLVRELKSNTNYRTTEPVKPSELCLTETIDL